MGVQELIKSNKVVVFENSWCPYCRQAKEALKSKGIDHKVVEVDAALKRELVALTGQTSVPQVFVKETFVGGANDGGIGGTLPLLKNGTIQKMLAA